MAITIGAIAGCDGCSYGCHCWLLLLGAIAWGAMAGVSHGAGCHARGGISGTVAECHGGVPLRWRFGVKSFFRCRVRAWCFGVEKQTKLFIHVCTIWGLCWIFSLEFPQVHWTYETFESSMGEKPIKTLRKVWVRKETCFVQRGSFQR